MDRRIGASEEDVLVTQSNLASTYQELGQFEKVMCLRRDVYFGSLRLEGKESNDTLLEANNYALSLVRLQRFEETKALLRKTMPVARDVLGESHDVTLRIRWTYACALIDDPGATLDDLREAVGTLEAVAKLWKRVMGERHPEMAKVQSALATVREKLADARVSESKPPP